MLIKSAVQLAVPVLLSMEDPCPTSGRDSPSLLRSIPSVPEHLPQSTGDSHHLARPSWNLQVPGAKNTAGVEPIIATEALENLSRVEHSRC